jgi:acyl-CoA hydrolase
MPLHHNVPHSKTPDNTAYKLNIPIDCGMVNKHNRLRPDLLLKWIDIAGCIPAKRHMGDGLDPVTASVDRLNFFSVIRAWDIVTLDAKLTKVWGTSMEARVVVTAWDFRSGEVRLVASAYLILVAKADHGQTKTQASHIAKLELITPEDHLLEQSAVVRKEYRAQEAERTLWVPMEASEEGQKVKNEHLAGPADSNGLGNNVFGGVILTHVYQTASQAAEAFVGHANVVCARQDRMDFRAPAYLGEVLKTKAIVTRTWKASFEVQVECEAHNEATGEQRLIATTYMVFVHLCAANGAPSPSPVWQPTSEAQRQRSEGAAVRRQLREAEASHFTYSL